MALFGKKVSVESILKDIAQLSEEDKAKVLDGLKSAEDTGEQVAEAENDIAAKGEDTQTTEDRVDESVAAQEEDEGDEDTQTAEDRIDESVGEEQAEDDGTSLEDRVAALEEKANDNAANEALAQRIAALEERLGKVVESLDIKPFGSKTETPENVDEEDDRDERVMRSYYGKNYRKY